MLRSLPALPALALLLAGCGSMLEADVTAKSVCVGHAAETFPGVIAGDPALFRELSYDLGKDLPLLNDPAVRYTLEVQRMEIALNSSSHLTDLGGFKSLSVTVLPPGGSALPEAQLVSYTRGAELHPTAIQAVGDPGVDLGPYLKAGQLRLQLAGAGSLPTRPWTAAVTTCFALKATVDLGKVR